jgi:hypothetical protein
VQRQGEAKWRAALPASAQARTAAGRQRPGAPSAGPSPAQGCGVFDIAENRAKTPLNFAPLPSVNPVVKGDGIHNGAR